MKIYQLATKTEDGQFLFDRQRMRDTISMLFSGRYLISFERINPRSTAKDYRRCYFAKLDALTLEVGETRYALHEMVKENIISAMITETPELFTNTDAATTQYLTLDGWNNLLQRLDLWAFTNYEIVLP